MILKSFMPKVSWMCHLLSLSTVSFSSFISAASAVDIPQCLPGNMSPGFQPGGGIHEGSSTPAAFLKSIKLACSSQYSIAPSALCLRRKRSPVLTTVSVICFNKWSSSPVSPMCFLASSRSAGLKMGFPGTALRARIMSISFSCADLYLTSAIIISTNGPEWPCKETLKKIHTHNKPQIFHVRCYSSQVGRNINSVPVAGGSSIHYLVVQTWKGLRRV